MEALKNPTAVSKQSSVLPQGFESDADPAALNMRAADFQEYAVHPQETQDDADIGSLHNPSTASSVYSSLSWLSSQAQMIEGGTSSGRLLPDPAALEVVTAYNELCPSFPKVEGLTVDRVFAVCVLFAQFDNDVDKLRELFRKAEGCTFLQGENKNHWRAGFDWLMKPEHALKVLEGHYWTHSGNTG